MYAISSGECGWDGGPRGLKPSLGGSKHNTAKSVLLGHLLRSQGVSGIPEKGREEQAGLQGLGCSREGFTAAAGPAVPGTKGRGVGPQLWGVGDSWPDGTRNGTGRAVAVASRRQKDLGFPPLNLRRKRQDLLGPDGTFKAIQSSG